MRRILVENARRKGRLKRGGRQQREALDLDALAAGLPDDDLLALHDSLERFAVHDPVKAKLVELRFFGGMSLPEVAEHLGIDPAWYSQRTRPVTEVLPWDHVNVKKGREYLEKEQQRSVVQLQVMADAK